MLNRFAVRERREGHPLELGKSDRGAGRRARPERSRRARWAAGALAAALLAVGVVGGHLAREGERSHDARRPRDVEPAHAHPLVSDRAVSTAKSASAMRANRERRAMLEAPTHVARESASNRVVSAGADGNVMDVPRDADELPIEDRALGAAVRVPPATRVPLPSVPDAPAPPPDLESAPRSDDPHDFDLSPEALERAPWSPPL